MDATNSQLGELQDALLLTYEAQNPNIVHLYPQAIANPGKYIIIYVYKLFHQKFYMQLSSELFVIQKSVSSKVTLC